MVESSRHPKEKGNSCCPCVADQLFMIQQSRDPSVLKSDCLFTCTAYLCFRAAVIQKYMTSSVICYDEHTHKSVMQSTGCKGWDRRTDSERIKLRDETHLSQEHFALIQLIASTSGNVEGICSEKDPFQFIFHGSL